MSTAIEGSAAAPQNLEVRVKSITCEAQDINSYELRPLGNKALPAFTAGAHIDLRLANGLIRSYSLVNPQTERHRYVIAVNKDAASRGGSRFMHEQLRPGDTVTISAPRNNFPLAEDARHSVLIAGGIGITPLWCMVQRLAELGRSLELYYCARTRQHAAFLDLLYRLTDSGQLSVHCNFDQEPGGKMLDIADVVTHAAPDTHIYCCGPPSMLQAFEKAAASRPPGTVHVEYFVPKEPVTTTTGFSVTLMRSGRTLVVPPGKTILEVLLAAGVDVPYSCGEGVCGTCETKVLEGVPDHRDLVLSETERAANNVMMICRSGAKSDRLVLDL